MYQRIILAADGSNNAVRACREAIKIAKLSNAKVDIVFVADIHKAKEEMIHANSPESLDLTRRQKIAEVEKLLRDEQVQYVVTILKGEPGPEIIRYTNEQNPDLIVLGSRGLNGLQEMVLGSVSHKVMKRVNCPALIVK